MADSKKTDNKKVEGVILTPELLDALKKEMSAEFEAKLQAALDAKTAEAQAELEAKRAEAEKKSEERALQGEKLLEQEEKSILAKLKAEPQVKILIPESELGDNGPVPVGIGGVIYTIPRGKEFLVPESIEKVWRNSYEKTLAANRKMTNKRMNKDAVIEIRD